MLKKIIFELLLQFQHFWVWYRPGEMFPNKKVRQVLKRLWERSRTQQSGQADGAEPVCKICSSPAVGKDGYCQVCR